MSYTPIDWVQHKTPINEANLDRMENGIVEAHKTADANTERIKQIAGNQIPEEYLQASVDSYISKNQAGLATKMDVNNLDSKLSSEIANIVKSLYSGFASNNTVLFTNNDVEENTYVYYDLTAQSNKSGFIELLDANNTRIGVYGRLSSWDTESSKNGRFQITSNFSYARALSDGTGVTINSLLTYPKDDEIQNHIYTDFEITSSVDMVKGSVSANGEFSESEISLVSGNYIQLKGKKVSVKLPSDWESMAFYYDINDRFVTYSSVTSGECVYGADYEYMKLVVRKVNHSEISLIDLPSSFSVESTYYVEEVLKKVNSKIETNLPYILESTNDTTDRVDDIQNALERYKQVKLGKGTFYVSSRAIVIPNGAELFGCSHETILYSTLTIGYAISLTDNCHIHDFVIRGLGNNTIPTSQNNGGVYVVKPDTKNRIENIDFINLMGTAIYSANTYSNEEHDTNIITKCRFKCCAVGIDIGERSEGNNISDNNITSCGVGIHCIGGNNRVNGNIFRSCNIGISLDNSNSASNDGHCIFANNVIIHNDKAIVGVNIANGSVFNGCTIFYGNVELTSCYALLFIGCEIGSGVSFISNGGNGNRLSNSIILLSESPTISNFIVNDCSLKDGTLIS